MYIDTTICLHEIDVNWNITWPTTGSGQMVRQKCPGGAESIGMYTYYSIRFLIHTFVSIH